ncbi:dipeptidyl peptidase 3 isoform X3 [Bacillus rossius redtenbacheri]|uniref:dipeptidyl peptidase 3 isoform X3 n=1 Tax=Bacillus rossius redtenbacheri TaxID=93214 RepID=UPI002FDDA7E3
MCYFFFSWHHTAAMKDLDQHMLPNNYPIVELDCKVAFDCISPKQKLYCHYLNLASWHGSLIVYLQTSPESPIIFSVLTKTLLSQPIAELREASLSKGVTEDDFTAFLVYAAVFYSNNGNYRGFGDTKFIPNVSKEKLEALLKASKAWNKDLQAQWEECRGPIYSLSEREKQLSFPDKGVTAYLSKNCSKDDAVLVNEFLKSRGLEGYNTRLFKTTDNGVPKYEIRLASAEAADRSEEEREFKGSKFVVSRGDYSPILDTVVQHLKKAKEYADNEFEKAMLEYYAKSFKTGSLDAHKDGSRQWIKNKKPAIETYIGFIETYRDPAGVRGEWQGFVAMVNKPMSEKFSKLVDKAESLLQLLPWDRSFEKDKFLQPDFTSLDVLCFAGSGIPAGINIPNYDEIRQVEGFKNVSLGNVIPAYFKEPKIAFLGKEDAELLDKYRVSAFEIQVGLHELLGHGSGKMFAEEGGKLNFDPQAVKDPFTSKPITSYYKEGETYDSKFTTMSSTYEECRAECVGLYLSLVQDVVRIFGIDEVAVEDVTYVNWLSLVHTAVAKALEHYQPASKLWLQAHSQARFVIMRVLLEAGQGLVEVTETEPGKDLLLKLDRSKIRTVGRTAIGDFLHKLQVYKATGDVESARSLYNKYSEVPEDGPYPFARWREIVLLHKKPRRVFVQPNTMLSDKEVTLKIYPATPEGVVQSFLDRFNVTPDPSDIMHSLWQKDCKHFL